jgi:hypothetical protein
MDMSLTRSTKTRIEHFSEHLESFLKLYSRARFIQTRIEAFSTFSLELANYHLLSKIISISPGSFRKT